MIAILQNLPNEIVEHIVSLLSLRDVRSLRLCSRTLAVKATQDHFHSFCHAKHVDVTESALQEFVDQTQPGRLGCNIRSLTLVGVVNNTMLLRHLQDYLEGEIPYTKSEIQHHLSILQQRDSEYVRFHESGLDVELLSTAFRNLQSHGLYPSLESLTLTVQVYRQDSIQRKPPQGSGSWKLIWQSAAETFHTAIRSLAISALPIEKLNVFNDCQLQGCSLACDELTKVDVNDPGLARSMKTLRSLSISFSIRMDYSFNHDSECRQGLNWDTPCRDYGVRRVTDANIHQADECNFSGLARVLQLCDKLQNLELHQYKLHTERYPFERVRAGECLLKCVAAMPKPLHKLKHLELRGFDITEQSLLAIFQKLPFRELSIYDMYLLEGNYRSFIVYCTTRSPTIERLHFETLRTTSGEVDFGESDCEVDELYPGGARHRKLDRSWSTSTQSIRFHMTDRSNVPSSPWHHNWWECQIREYGPPQALAPERNAYLGNGRGMPNLKAHRSRRDPRLPPQTQTRSQPQPQPQPQPQLQPRPQPCEPSVWSDYGRWKALQNQQ